MSLVQCRWNGSRRSRQESRIEVARSTQARTWNWWPRTSSRIGRNCMRSLRIGVFWKPQDQCFLGDNHANRLNTSRSMRGSLNDFGHGMVTRSRYYYHPCMWYFDDVEHACSPRTAPHVWPSSLNISEAQTISYQSEGWGNSRSLFACIAMTMIWEIDHTHRIGLIWHNSLLYW